MYDELCSCQDLGERQKLVKRILVTNSKEQEKLYNDLERVITKGLVYSQGFYNIDVDYLRDDVYMHMLNEGMKPYVETDISFKSYLSTLIFKHINIQCAQNFGLEAEDYKLYLKIQKICDNYKIPFDKKNAYKICLINNSDKRRKKINISTVCTVIEKASFCKDSANTGLFEELCEYDAI